MHCSRLRVVGLLAAACLVSGWQANGQRRSKKYEEPKSQVLPLPHELPMVLAAETNSLDFHVSPLLKVGGLSAQIRRSLSDLIRDTHGETIIKLRAFVSGAGDARRVGAEVSSMFTEHKLPLPVLTVVGVGGLGDDLAKVVIEAVVGTRRVMNPAGLAFLSGQTGKSLQTAVERLRDNAAEASIPTANLLQCSCFAARVDDESAARSAVSSIFPQAAVTVVQALRDPADDSVTCDAVAKLNKTPDSTLVLMKQSRVALVNAPRLVFTGMQLTFGSYLDDAREAFSRLQRTVSTIEPGDAPVEVNAFSLDATAAAALRKTTQVSPSTFTVHTIEALPAIDASSGIEAVMAAESPGQPPNAH